MIRFLKIAISGIASVVLLLGFSLFFTPWGYNRRITLAEMLLSSQHGYLAYDLWIPKKEIKQLNQTIFHPKYVNTNPKKIKISTPKPKKKKKIKIDTIRLISIQHTYSPTDYYKGKVIFVSNPQDVKLAVTQLHNFGQQINILAQNSDAIAAINAGGFLDVNGVGNGGTPSGIVINKGEVLHNDGNMNIPDYVAGITKSGVLVTGYYSPKNLLKLGVQYAAGFRPELIANGKKIPMSGDGGWGIGPRTAIGQTKNGTLILLEIDGRQPGYSIGASIVQIQSLMFKYGAINATCMDGGSSSSVYFMGENITIPSSIAHIPRYLPNAWVVVPPKNQSYRIYENGVLIKSISKKNGGK